MNKPQLHVVRDTALLLEVDPDVSVAALSKGLAAAGLTLIPIRPGDRLQITPAAKVFPNHKAKDI